MKRIIGIILVAALALTMCAVMAACGKNNSSSSSSSSEAEKTASQTEAPAAAQADQTASQPADNGGQRSIQFAIEIPAVLYYNNQSPANRFSVGLPVDHPI